MKYHGLPYTVWANAMALRDASAATCHTLRGSYGWHHVSLIASSATMAFRWHSCLLVGGAIQ